MDVDICGHESINSYPTLIFVWPNRGIRDDFFGPQVR